MWIPLRLGRRRKPLVKRRLRLHRQVATVRVAPSLKIHRRFRMHQSHQLIRHPAPRWRVQHIHPGNQPLRRLNCPIILQRVPSRIARCRRLVPVLRLRCPPCNPSTRRCVTHRMFQSLRRRFLGSVNLIRAMSALPSVPRLEGKAQRQATSRFQICQHLSHGMRGRPMEIRP